MKRGELTVKIMEDKGWQPTDRNELRLKDIVFNIQNNEEWKHLRCRIDSNETYSETEFGMCSTYEVYLHKEFLEVSSDNVEWFPVAFRFVEFNRRCKYAD